MADRFEPAKLEIPEGAKIHLGVVKAQFNADITDAQLEELKRFCEEYGFTYEVVEVPGSYEMVYALQELAQQKKYQALVALGCLIKGGTIHFEVIAYGVGNAILDLVSKHHIPIGFGVITANTHEQAVERTVIGYDAAHAAVSSFLLTQ